MMKIIHCHGTGDGAHFVMPVNSVHQFFYNGVSTRLVHLGNFIADAPQEDGGVIPVPPDEIRQIPFRAPVENFRVVVNMSGLHFPVCKRSDPDRFLPFVKSLVKHKDTLFIAGVEKFFGRRIVGCADRVASVFLQNSELACDAFSCYSASQGAAVGMKREAFDLVWTAIEQAAFFRIEYHGTEAETAGETVYDIPLQGDFRQQRVEMRGFRRPELWIVQMNRIGQGDRQARSDRMRRRVFIDGTSAGVFDPMGNRDASAFVRFVVQVIFQIEFSMPVRNFFIVSQDIHSPAGYFKTPVTERYFHAPVNPAAGIPAA